MGRLDQLFLMEIKNSLEKKKRDLADLEKAYVHKCQIVNIVIRVLGCAECSA